MVTDEQINELRNAATFNVNSTHAGIRSEARATVRLCDRALDPTYPHRDEARAECVKLVAARARAA